MLAVSAGRAAPKTISWVSPSVGQPVTVSLYPGPAHPATTLVFLENLNGSTGNGLERQTEIAQLRAHQTCVVTVDYQHSPNAHSPELNSDFLALRRQLPAWLGSESFSPGRCFILPAGYRLVPDVEYFNSDGHSFRMDIWMPVSRAGSLPAVPCVIQFAHNNAARTAAENYLRYQDTLLDGLATLGFAVAMADHPTPPPGVSTYQMPDVVYKTRAAVRTLRATLQRGGLAAGKVGVVGFSRGGAVAALAALADPAQVPGDTGPSRDFPESVQAAYCASGRYDALAAATAMNGEKGLALVEAWGDPQQHADRWRNASPVHYVTRRSPPFFLTVGINDQPFRIAQSHLLDEALTRAGTPHTLVILPATGHALPDSTETLRQIAAFFQETLAGAP